jgi:hypothetical protein
MSSREEAGTSLLRSDLPIARLAERERVSRTPGVQATQHLFGGNSDRTFAVKLIKPSIEFFALRISERNCFRGRRQAVPELLKELKLLFSAKCGDVDHRMVLEIKK